MSQQALEAIIGRAILDDEFRMILFAEPNSALAVYELTETEEAKIRSVDAESLDACAVILRRHREAHYRKRNPYSLHGIKRVALLP